MFVPAFALLVVPQLAAAEVAHQAARVPPLEFARQLRVVVDARAGAYRVRPGASDRPSDVAQFARERLRSRVFVCTTCGSRDSGGQPYVVSVCSTLEELDQRLTHSGN